MADEPLAASRPPDRQALDCAWLAYALLTRQLDGRDALRTLLGLRDRPPASSSRAEASPADA